MIFNRFHGRALFVSLAFIMTSSLAFASEPVRLITPDEARLPAPLTMSSQTRNLSRGPGIDAVAPPAIGVGNSPFRLAVKFKARNSVPVDPATVRITYQRQPIVDLTPRVKSFITAEGIEAPAVIVPPGKHVIEIEATDKEGRVGRGHITLNIDAPT